MARSTVTFLRRIVADVRAAGPEGAAIRALEVLNDGDAMALRDRLCSVHPCAAERGIRIQFVADVLSDAATWIENHDKNKQRALERVEWIRTGGARVARVGRHVFRLTGSGTRLRLMRLDSEGREMVDLGTVSSTEAGARRIRAYRAGKWPRKGGR